VYIKLGNLTDYVILQLYSRRILCRIWPAVLLSFFGLSCVFPF